MSLYKYKAINKEGESYEKTIEVNDKGALYRHIVVSVIDEARSNTLASVEATTYGVYFDTDSVISFKGATYVGEEDSNEIYELHSKVEISDVALAGGGNEIVFERLTGQVSEVGTVTLSLKDAFDSTLLTISGTGTVASE